MFCSLHSDISSLSTVLSIALLTIVTVIKKLYRTLDVKSSVFYWNFSVYLVYIGMKVFFFRTKVQRIIQSHEQARGGSGEEQNS